MVEILNKNHKYWVNKNLFLRLIQRLVKHYNLKNPEVTLAFVNSQTIRELNRRFLNKDKSTDVLSFPIGEKGADGKFYLGDIIISTPQAFHQCFNKQHGLERELELLTIHGFLHLLGYEHFKGLEEEEEKIRHLMLEGYNGH